MDLKTANGYKKLTADLVKIAVENKLDYLKVDGIEIKKSIHFKPEEIKNLNQQTGQPTDEDLYWSSTPNPRMK